MREDLGLPAGKKLGKTGARTHICSDRLQLEFSLNRGRAAVAVYPFLPELGVVWGDNEFLVLNVSGRGSQRLDFAGPSVGYVARAVIRAVWEKRNEPA